jgi:hypothetical protein
MIIIIIILSAITTTTKDFFSECKGKFSDRLRRESEEASPFNVEVKKEWS